MTDREDEHQPLAPASALLKTIEGPAVEGECDIGSPIKHEARGFAMGQLAHFG